MYSHVSLFVWNLRGIAGGDEKEEEEMKWAARGRERRGCGLKRCWEEKVREGKLMYSVVPYFPF